MRLGKLSDSVLKRSVLKQIKTKRQEVLNGAGVGEDCAIFASAEGFISCVSETEIRDRGDIERAVIKGANNLATAGARPVAVMITLLLPQETEEQILKELMQAAEAVCSRIQLQIAGGHTTVSRHVDIPILCLTAYGLPMNDICVRDGFPALTTRGAKPGEDIVLTKWIGLEGTAILARYNRDKLLKRYPAHLVDEAAGFDRYLSIIPEAAVAAQSGVRVMHDVSEGGILAALWELAESSGVGLSVDMRRIPIRQETVEVCELCEANPYLLAGGGCLMAVTAHGEALVEELARKQIPAVVIGQITEGRDRLIYNDDEKRYLDKPAQDEIYKILS